MRAFFTQVQTYILLIWLILLSGSLNAKPFQSSFAASPDYSLQVAEKELSTPAIFRTVLANELHPNDLDSPAEVSQQIDSGNYRISTMLFIVLMMSLALNVFLYWRVENEKEVLSEQ